MTTARKPLSGYFGQTLAEMTPTPTLAGLFAAGASDTCYPLSVNTQHRRDTFNGTVAISQLAAHLGLDSDDRVLIPAYFCGSELGPFEQRNCKIDFYNIDKDLQVDLDDLAKALRKPARLVLVTHYFGFPQSHMDRIRALCDSNDTLLVEDCAHALFSADHSGLLGQYGDYAVFSPRKSLPLVDGGILVARSTLNPNGHWASSRPPLVPTLFRLGYGLQRAARRPAKGLSAILARAALALLMPLSVANKLLRSARLLPSWQWSTADVEGPEAIPFYSAGMSAFGRRALQRVRPEDVIAARRANYMAWDSALRTTDCCRPLFSSLPDTVCPLYYPIIAENPGDVVSTLAAQQIEAFNWWPHLQDGLDWQQHPHLVALKNRIVALPLHQQMTPEHIHTIALRVIASLTRTTPEDPDRNIELPESIRIADTLEVTSASPVGTVHQSRAS